MEEVNRGGSGIFQKGPNQVIWETEVLQKLKQKCEIMYNFVTFSCTTFRI